MSEFKGTPGPWVAVEKYIDEPLSVVDSNGFKVVSAERVAILDGWDEKGFQHWGDTGGHRELPPTEYKANSRLIAAAPDLLKVLDLILSYHDDGNCVLHREDVSMARAAIKKALGQ